MTTELHAIIISIIAAIGIVIIFVIIPRLLFSSDKRDKDPTLYSIRIICTNCWDISTQYFTVGTLKEEELKERECDNCKNKTLKEYYQEKKGKK